MRFLSFVFFCSIMTLFVSCKKSSSSASVCKIAAIQYDDGQSYSFTYDGQGRLQTEKYVNSTSYTNISFQYGTNLVVKVSTDQLGNTSKDSLFLNSDGSVAKDLFSRPSDSDKAVYTYSSGSEVQYESYQSYSTTVSPVYYYNYTFANGDMTIDGSGGTYTYYPDEPYQVGDYTELSQFEQYGAGNFVTKSTHLVKSMSNRPGENVTFAYNFDKTGKITSIQLGGSATGEIDIIYACQN